MSLRRALTRALSFAFLTSIPGTALAAPTVWAIDDGEKIKQDAPATGLATGAGNPVWAPGQPIRLFAMKNETVAFQIVVHADVALSDVTVDLDTLTSGAATIANAPGATDPTSFVGRPIERFVEHFFDIPRASGGKFAGESLDWSPGSGPTAGKYVGKVPDALIPVEVAPSWSKYPMAIAANTNGIVWLDVTVPKSQAPGLYEGTVVVKSSGAAIASIPVALEVVNVTLGERPVKTMLVYSREELARRMGEASADAAEKHLFQLYHRHRLSALHSALDKSEITRRLPALDGSMYTAQNGYEGPAEAMGDGVLSLGLYGGFGAPTTTTLRTVEGIADQLASKGLLETTDTFVYAIDEDCASPYGAEWKRLIAGSANANVKKVRVAWTCSAPAAKQPVDIAIQASTFDPADAAKARAAGKEVWSYNGHMPQTGAFFTDSAAINLRVNGWLPAMFDIGRWFFWETTFWYDDNDGGNGAYDPFVTSETFHNGDGDFANGDGVLVYPGKQVDKFGAHSIGMNGVVASIRLKNWRRGVEDAGYYQLAHDADPTKAEAIAKALLPAVLSEAKDGKPASWGEDGKPFFDARKALLALIPNGATGGDGPGASSSGSAGNDPGSSGGPGASATDDGGGCGCRSVAASRQTTSVLVGGGVLFALALVRRRRALRRALRR